MHYSFEENYGDARGHATSEENSWGCGVSKYGLFFNFIFVVEIDFNLKKIKMK